MSFDIKKFLKSKHNYMDFLNLDKDIVNYILDIMFCSNNDNRTLINVDLNDLKLLNLMYEYLNNYEAHNISRDFYNKFSGVNLNYRIEFYIFFILTYYKMFNIKVLFSQMFINNLNELFYSNDIESLFNSDKFKFHYGNVYTDTLSLNEDVSLSIREYIASNLPNTITDDAEKAIAIYILLTKVLRYSPGYTLNKNYFDTIPYFDVTLENNEVVCVQFSIIYHKLLKEYGIEANLAGNMKYHMFVNLNFGTLSFRADATKYGYYTEQFELSDMTNSKYDFFIKGLFIPKNTYSDYKYIDYANKRLENLILVVYDKLGINIDKKKILDMFLDNKIDSLCNGDLSFVESVELRMNFLNKYFSFIEHNVEATQLYNFLIRSVFRDIPYERIETIMLYRYTIDNKMELSKVLVLYDENFVPYYYFSNNGKLLNYSVDDLVNVILDNDWNFAHLTDIDALLINDEEVILKLVRG